MLAIPLLLASTASAQEGPELHGLWMPTSQVRPVDEPDAAPAGAEAALTSWGLSTPTPPIRLIEDRWVLANILAFEHTRTRIGGAGFLAGDEATQDLFRIQWGLASVWTPSDRATVAVLVQPGIYSDLAGPFGVDDMGLVALALGVWKFSDGFALGLGGGSVQFFGRPTLTPLLSLTAETGRLSVSLLLPQEGAVWVRLADAASIGVRGSFDGGFYHVRPDDSRLPEAYQTYSVLTAGPVLQLTLRDRLIVELDGGLAPLRTLDVYADRDTRVLAMSLEPGWSLAATLRVAMGQPADEEEPAEAADDSADEDQSD
ncbi:MAG: hypothetical protein ACI8PZ_001051 [Myxococcota bacterium]|jgi:hypothetical protein